jgi:PAS domain S-box-containing protein
MPASSVQEAPSPLSGTDPLVRAADIVAAFEHANVGMAIANDRATILHANAALGAILGHAPEALVGRSVVDLTHPEDLADSLAYNERLVRGEITHFSLEKRYVHATGREVWTRVYVSTLPGGSPGYRVVHVVDVTHEKTAAAALREVEARFREMTESIEQDFWLMRVSPQLLLYSSPAARRLWGFDPMVNRARPHRILSRIHPDDRPVFTSLFAPLPDEPREREYRIVRADGAVRWFRTRLCPLRDADGVVDRLAGMTEDVTTRKTAEAEVERHRAFERLLLKLSTDFANLPAERIQEGFESALGELAALCGADRVAVFLLDESDVLKSSYTWSVAGERRTPATFMEFAFGPDHPLRAALVRDGVLRVDDVRTLPDDVSETRERLLADGIGSFVDVPLVRRGRLLGLYGCATLGRPMDWPAEVADRLRIAAELFVTVIERLRAEADMRRHRDALARALHVGTVGRLAAAIGHELNQPLASILNYALGCERRLAAGELDVEQLRDATRKIAEQAVRASEVMATLRNLVRKGSERRAPHDLNDVVRSALRFIEQDAMHAGVRIAVGHRAGLPPVLVDAIQVEQVVLNLVRNALDAITAAPRHPTRSEIRVLTRSRAPDAVEVSVADDGPGIEPERAESIFDEFYTTKPEGLGLGLAISRAIIEAHGGRLWLDTSAGPGATFRFTLSAAP